jgi:hypothetical protein
MREYLSEQLKVVAGLLQIGVVYDKTFGEFRVVVSSVIDTIAQFLGDVEINLPEIDRIVLFETIQGIFATVNFSVKN